MAQSTYLHATNGSSIVAAKGDKFIDVAEARSFLPMLWLAAFLPGDMQRFEETSYFQPLANASSAGRRLLDAVSFIDDLFLASGILAGYGEILSHAITSSGLPNVTIEYTALLAGDEQYSDRVLATLQAIEHRNVHVSLEVPGKSIAHPFTGAPVNIPVQRFKGLKELLGSFSNVDLRKSIPTARQFLNGEASDAEQDNVFFLIGDPADKDSAWGQATKLYFQAAKKKAAAKSRRTRG